jgi:hypothetical protein
MYGNLREGLAAARMGTNGRFNIRATLIKSADYAKIKI